MEVRMMQAMQKAIQKDAPVSLPTQSALKVTGDLACIHCGTTISRKEQAETRVSKSEAFCCGGCAVAYSIIQSFGLSDYYDMPSRQTGRPADLDASGPVSFSNDYRQFDESAFQKEFATDLGNGR